MGWYCNRSCLTCLTCHNIVSFRVSLSKLSSFSSLFDWKYVSVLKNLSQRIYLVCNTKNAFTETFRYSLQLTWEMNRASNATYSLNALGSFCICSKIKRMAGSLRIAWTSGSPIARLRTASGSLPSAIIASRYPFWASCKSKF